MGQGTRPRRSDVDDIASVEAAVDEIGTIVTCVAQREFHLLRSAIARGLTYTDIAPWLVFWRGAEQLDAQARRTGARILLGAGLSPGISNMMARKLADTLGRVGRIETAVVLSLGDEYGSDSLHHIFEAIIQSFSIVEDGCSRVALPFSEGAGVEFPDPLGTKTAYLFPWSDVVYYPKTLGAQAAIGRFALEPAWSGHLVALLMRAGARRWLRRPGFAKGSHCALDRLAPCYGARDGFALVVTAEAAGRTARSSLVGRKQAEATADGAAELARLLAEGEMSEPGVWLPEQVVSADGFFDALARTGWNFTFEEPTLRDDNRRAPRAARAEQNDERLPLGEKATGVPASREARPCCAFSARCSHRRYERCSDSGSRRSTADPSLMPRFKTTSKSVLIFRTNERWAHASWSTSPR